MLQQFLKIVETGEVLNHFQIAQQMKISPGMVVQIAQDLARRGYLAEYNAECCEQNPACEGCMLSSGCHQNGHTWILTDKGKKALSH